MSNIEITQEILKMTNTKLNQWYTIIDTRIKKNIVFQTKWQQLQKPISSGLLNHIQHQYSQLCLAVQMQGWSNQVYYQYRLLKTLLKTNLKE